MDNFIEIIGSYVTKYAPLYGIKVHSPIIAQAILESARGTSELARNAHNYFGLKWHENRCPTAIGYYEKVGFEQNKDWTYTPGMMKWMKFTDVESGVKGYFDFINTSNYSTLKGVTDPEKYLRLIKDVGYATSLNYVENLMKVIADYDLTRFDKGVNRMKIIALDAGHGVNTAGKRCMKAIDPNETREWYLNDRISDRVEELLADYDCKVVRVGDTTGKKDISRSQRVATANNINADVYISVHHNAGINGGYGGGTVVYYYSTKPERKEQAQRLYNEVVNRTGLVGDRGSKILKKAFDVVKNTKMPAFLIENGFMDSRVDVPIILSAEHAEKTAQGILAFLVKEYSLNKKEVVNEANTKPQKVYRVQCGAFSNKKNAEALQRKLKNEGYEAIVV